MHAAEALVDARTYLGEARSATAAPYVVEVQAAEARVHQAERDAMTARIRDRLGQLDQPDRARTLDRGLGIEL